MAGMYQLPSSVRVLCSIPAGNRSSLIFFFLISVMNIRLILSRRKQFIPFILGQYRGVLEKAGILVQRRTRAQALFKDEYSRPAFIAHFSDFTPNHKALCPTSPINSQVML